MPETIKASQMSLPDKLRAYTPWILAGIILIFYGVFIFVMFDKTSVDDEKEWTKITYIFSSLEAIVFTAVGFVFGSEVNRSRAIKAENDAEKQKKDLAREVRDALAKMPQAPVSPKGSQSPPSSQSQMKRDLLMEGLKAKVDYILIN